MIWYFLFWSCIVAGVACSVAGAVGRADLASVFGAIFTILMGSSFLHGCYLSAKNVGEAWVVGFGWVTRQSQPLVYWAALSIPTSVGVLVLLIGIYWCARIVSS